MEIDPINRARRAVTILRRRMDVGGVPVALCRCQRIVAVAYGFSHWYALARHLRQAHVDDRDVVATRRARLEAVIRAAVPHVASSANAIAEAVFPSSSIILRPAMSSRAAEWITIHQRRTGDAVEVALCGRQGGERSTFYISASPGRLRFFSVGGTFDDERHAFSAVDLTEGSQDHFVDDGRILGCLLLGPEAKRQGWARDPRHADDETAWRRMSHARDALLAVLDEPALEILSACDDVRDVESAYAYYVEAGVRGRLRRDLARRRPWLASHVVPERDRVDAVAAPPGPEGSLERVLGSLAGLTQAQSELVASRLGRFPWRERERAVLAIALRVLAAVDDRVVPTSEADVEALLSVCRLVHEVGFDRRSAHPDAAVRVVTSMATEPWAKVEERWASAAEKAMDHLLSRGIDITEADRFSWISRVGCFYRTLDEIIAAVAWRVVRPALLVTGADPRRTRMRDHRDPRRGPARIPAELFEGAIAHLVLEDFDIRFAATTIQRWAAWRAEADRGDAFENPPTTADLERVLDKLRPFLGPRYRSISLDDVLLTWERNMSAREASRNGLRAGTTLLAPPEDEAVTSGRDGELDDGSVEEAMTSTTFYRARIGPAMFEAWLDPRGFHVARVDGHGNADLPLGSAVVVWCRGRDGRNGWQACDGTRDRPCIDLSDLDAGEIGEFGHRFNTPIDELPVRLAPSPFAGTPADAGLRRFVRDHGEIARRYADSDPDHAGWHEAITEDLQESRSDSPARRGA